MVTNPCDHGPGCCVECCPAEPNSTGTGGRAGFAAFFGGRL